MPIDTKASEYQWYFNVDVSEREVRIRWRPSDGIGSSLALGYLNLQTKNEKGEWVNKSEDPDGATPWVVAQKVARNEGMAVEVVVY